MSINYGYNHHNRSNWKSNNGRNQGYSKFRRNKSYGGERDVSNNNEFKRNSFGSEVNSFDRDSKPKKPASMIEHVEPLLPPSAKMAKELLTRVGDFSSMGKDDDVSSSVKALATTLLEVDDLREYSDDIAEIFADCMSLLTVQASIISTVLALISQQDTTFTSLVLSKLVNNRLVKSLSDGDMLTSKVILRSLATLASCKCLTLEGLNGFCNLLHMFISVSCSEWSTNTEKSGNSPSLSPEEQARTYLIAQTVPWALDILVKSEIGRATLDRVLPILMRVLSDWRSPYCPGGKLAIFHLDSAEQIESNYRLSEGPSGGSACWDNLWEACSKCLDMIHQAQIDHGFTPPPSMNCPWILLSDDFKVESNISLSDGTIASLESLQQQGLFLNGLSSSLFMRKTSRWLIPRFSIFDRDSSPQMAELTSQLTLNERRIAVDYCTDILFFFDPIIREDGTFVGTVDLLCTHLLALSRLFPQCSHMQYIWSETLLCLLTQLPHDSTRFGGLCRIILQLCKRDPLMPSVLALGTSILFQLGVDMDSLSWRAVNTWLAFHLTNTKLAWPYWDYWGQELPSYGVHSETRLFLRLLIHKCARAVVSDQLRAALPESLHSLAPQQSGPYCILLDPNVGDGDEGAVDPGLKDIAQELCKLMERREEADTVEEWLSARDPPQPALTEWQLVVMAQALSEAGRPAPSLLLSLLDRYRDTLRALADTDVAKMALLDAVIDMYSTHQDGPGLNFVIDALLRRAVLTADVVISRLSSPTSLSALTVDPWLYTRIETVVDRAVDVVLASAQLYASCSRPQIAGGGTDQSPDEVVLGSKRGRGNDEDNEEMDAGGRRGDPDVPLEMIGGGEDMDDGEGGLRDPSTLTREALQAALIGSRRVYSDLVGGLLTSMIVFVPLPADAAEDAAQTSHQVAALSLLVRNLRVMHEAQILFKNIVSSDDVFTNEFLIDSTEVAPRIAELTSRIDFEESRYSLLKTAISTWQQF